MSPLALLLARLMDQYCFAGCRLSSSVTLPAVGPVGRRARGPSARRRPGTWAVGPPTLHGGPVVLRLVRATPCFLCVLRFVHTGCGALRCSMLCRFCRTPQETPRRNTTSGLNKPFDGVEIERTTSNNWEMGVISFVKI